MTKALKIEWVDPYHLTPYFQNNREHTQKQIEQIAKSIDQFGFLQPVVIDKENVIIVGHARVEAQKLRGNDPVPVIRVDNLTEDQIRTYRLVDNKLSTDVGYNWEAVIAEIEAISSEELLTAFSLEPWAIRAGEIIQKDIQEIDLSTIDESISKLSIETEEPIRAKEIITAALKKGEVPFKWSK